MCKFLNWLKIFVKKKETIIKNNANIPGNDPVKNE